MSTPISIGEIFGNVLSAIVDALNTVVNVIVANLPTIMEISLVVGLVGSAFYLIRRSIGALTGWVRGFLRF